MSDSITRLPDPNPSGLCFCGCGDTTPIATRTYQTGGRNIVRGKHLRYVPGHSPVAISPQHYKVDPQTGCWVWQRSTDTTGYGRFMHNGVMVAAHRFYYELHKGPIPEGLQLDHLCRNKRCVNPEHLEAVTQAENIRRASKLTHSDASEIRRRYLEGENPNVIGSDYGIGRSYVWRIGTGRCWEVRDES